MHDETKPPRFLFRRLVALFVDWTIVALLTTVVMYPLVKGNTDNIRYSGASVEIGGCWPATTAPQELHDLIAPHPIQELVICQRKPFGFDNGLEAELTFDMQETRRGAVTSRTYKEITTPISNNGIPVDPLTPQTLLILLGLVAGSAIWPRGNAKQSPGKKLLGLSVETASQAAMWKREFLRFAPFFVFAVFEFAPLGMKQIWIANVQWFVALSVVVLVFLLWYYIWPLIRWQGAMRYDRISGTRVLRRER